MAEDQQSNISINANSAYLGLNLNSIIRQIKPGILTYALNAQVENWDGNSLTIQNEQANELCAVLPNGYKVIGQKNIIELGITVVWLANPLTSGSEIGKVVNCVYSTLINSPCLGFSIYHPILKSVYKLTNCTTEVYWTDGTANGRRWIDLDNLPFKEIEGCPPTKTSEVDCNKLRVQPRFSIPEIVVSGVRSDGDLVAGDYQFAVQYANALGEEYTSYYSITNPLPIFDPTKITQDFNFHVGKSIVLDIRNIDTTGFYDFFNIAVIKTINNITSVELVGTFNITGDTKTITYTGQGKTDIRLTIDDIFEKFPVYDIAQDVTSVQDVIVWSGVTTNERISYQKISNQISLKWQTWKIPGDKAYAKELNDVYLRGYMRDEIYPFEIVFLLKNGYQTDGFHIPGRVSQPYDLESISNDDVVDVVDDKCNDTPQPRPRWQVYNTASNLGKEQVYLDFTNGVTYPCPKCPPIINTNPSHIDCYEGPYEYGEMAYWESTDTYPCDVEIWGALANQPIRHPKFPDSTITHIHDDSGNIYPIGVKIDVWQIINLINNSDLTQEQKDNITGFKIVRGNRVNNKSVVAKGLVHNVGKYSKEDQTYYFPNYPYNDLNPDRFLGSSQTSDDESDSKTEEKRLKAFNDDDSKSRMVFHSPDTHFYQPFLGNILKLETAEFGKSKGHFVQVKKHARYKFLSSGTYFTSLGVGIVVGFLSEAIVTGNVFNGTAAFTTFKVLLDIIEKISPRKNFAYQFNSIGNYTDFKTISNNGSKQRFLNISSYMPPGMISIGDNHIVNNYQRESSVYLRTSKTLPYPSDIAGVPQDVSRWVLSDNDCKNDILEKDISSYYASIKNQISNQYGQIYSYETIDTGYQLLTNLSINGEPQYASVFGGDIFINRFAYKSKLPLFIDNRVGFPDESDVEYNEIGNVAFPLYWFSTDSTEDNAPGTPSRPLLNILYGDIKKIFGVKINNFDCDVTSKKFFYQDGKIYLFAYGIPYFYVESEVNVDLRQAYNGTEGDFFPRVSSDIPDDWLQEITTTIAQDNTYWYNKTFSKQNKENYFSHLPANFSSDECRRTFGFRAIYSEAQTDWIEGTSNKWLIYRPVSFFDFPDIIVSLDGIENKAVLARFASKSQLYNALLTVSTSNPKAAYLGNDTLFAGSPPIDFAETDLGFAGSQHKFLLKTEYGHIFADAKRGQIFLINGQKAQDITLEGVSKFFTEYLGFEIQKAFPGVNIDNHFNTFGLHGVYDTKYNRFIITKIDYKPIVPGMTYSDNKFYYRGVEVQVTDTNYFCNYSFTISYNFDIQSWVSFHTYIPNFYMGDANFFYSGNNNSSTSMWRHNTSLTKYNNFYGEIHPYIIEYPLAYRYEDELLQNIKDYTKVIKYEDWNSYTETDDIWFNKVILYNNQQTSGVLIPKMKPANNLSVYSTYPKYNTDSKEILFTKRDNFYNINTFWSLVKSNKSPIWKNSCENLSIFKELNTDNLDYGKRSFRKAPLRAKDLKSRFTLDDRDDVKMISQFIVQPSQKSYL